VLLQIGRARLETQAFRVAEEVLRGGRGVDLLSGTQDALLEAPMESEIALSKS
jgi:hypothetical protein